MYYCVLLPEYALIVINKLSLLQLLEYVSMDETRGWLVVVACKSETTAHRWHMGIIMGEVQYTWDSKLGSRN